MASFKTPSDDGPYYKRFFMMSYSFIGLFVEYLLPLLAAVAVFVVLVFALIFLVSLIGGLLGILPAPTDKKANEQPPKDEQADSPGLLPAKSEIVDKETPGEEKHDLTSLRQEILEKSLLKLEIDILKEMQQTRQAKLDKLDESN